MTARFQQLMAVGFSLSNKWHFKQWDQDEFEDWLQDCRSLLALCEPEPDGFPWCPDHRNIEEIVFFLQKVGSDISKGHIQYMGLF